MISQDGSDYSTLPSIPFYIVVQKSVKRTMEESFNSELSQLIGKFHLCCGALAFMAGAVLRINADSSSLDVVGAGMWTSPFFLLAGLLGIYSARRISAFMIITNMIVTISAAMFAAILTVMTLLALDSTYWCSNSSSHTQCSNSLATALNIVELLIGVIELVLGIISSSLSCRATCCMGTMDTNTQSKVMFATQMNFEPASTRRDQGGVLQRLKSWP